MTNVDFVDTRVDEFRDKLPQMLRQNPRTVAFLQAVSERAGAIVENAAVLGDAEAAYAKERIAAVLIAFGRETALRVV